MPSIRIDDGVDLHYIEAGSGTPMVFVHEFAGDGLSWEPQLRFFARRYRCIALFARGHAPDGIPAGPKSPGQDRAADDIAAVIAGLKLAPAHVLSLSTGAFAALQLGLRHPHLVRSLVAAGLVGGSAPDGREPLQEAGRRRMTTPTLVVAGDEDDPALEHALRLKRAICGAALAVLPGCGHGMNLDDPGAFNRAVLDFVTAVDGGSWRTASPLAAARS